MSCTTQSVRNTQVDSLTSKTLTTNPTLNEITQLLKSIQDSLNGQELYIIGGSACAILDWIYRDVPIAFRDFDLGIVLKKNINEGEARTLAENLLKSLPKAINYHSLEDRPRTPEEVPLKDNTLFTVGMGFLINQKCPHIPLVDVSCFAHWQDLEQQNGLLQQDSILIVIKPTHSFEAFIEVAKNTSFEKLVELRWVHQPEGAYQKWVEGNLSFRNWAEIGRRPHLHAMRLVRGVSKKGLLPQLITPHAKRNDLQMQWKDLHQFVSSSQPVELHLQSRIFERCLKDPNAAMEIKALSLLGIFDKWLPHLKEAVDWLSVDEICLLLNRAKSSSLQDSLLELSEGQPLWHKIHTLFFAFGSLVETSLSAKNIYCLLIDGYPDLGALDLPVCYRLIDQQFAKDGSSGFVGLT